MGKNNKVEKKKSKGLIIILCILFLILVFIGVFSTFYIKNKKKLSDTNIESIEKVKTENISLGDDFVVNLSQMGKARYIKANITVSYNIKDKELSENVEKKIPVFRDATIMYLKGLNEEEISNMESLKAGLIQCLNDSIEEKDFIADIYFQSFLIQ